MGKSNILRATGKYSCCQTEVEHFKFCGGNTMKDYTAIGLDMWIGALKERNNGYGTEALNQMVQLIHQK